MKYDFDEEVDRRGTCATKIDALKPLFGCDDLIPMWIADMCIKTPPFIMEAIRRRCESGVLGYTAIPDSYYDAISAWLGRRYGCQVDKSMIQFTPGIVSGLAFSMQAFTRPGDKILIQPPVYHPFFIYTEKNGRVAVQNPLILENGRYRMNIPQFRELVKECKMFILCNPHNPGGVIWNRKDLEEIAEICYDNGVIVVSDEIHADLALPGNKHTPFACISEKARMNSVTFMAPSKAFNIPGLSSSYAVIPNKELKERYTEELEKTESGTGHVFSYLAVEAAYGEGEEWLSQAMEYMQGNIDFLCEYISEKMPKIHPIRPQASYLVFLDCREMGLEQPELVRFFVDGAHLALNDGTMFGKEGAGFMRMNIGCPRSVVKRALDNMKSAYDSLFA